MKIIICLYFILFTTTHFQDSLLGAERTHYSVQVFGDFFWPSDGEKKYSVSLSQTFEKLRPLLQVADLNIVNFEGVATEAFMPHVLKSHLLRMAPKIGAFLVEQNIKVATLANNHSLDFGSQGLFDTLASLHSAGLRTTGAGMDLANARRPAIIDFGDKNFCTLAFNRTLPYEFYATSSKPGTNSVRFFEVVEQIANAKQYCHFILATFHWGWELAKEVQSYQHKLAKAAIDAGADAVVGHHPHVLQEHEVYRGKPIFYSIGNFVFITLPRHSKAEGMGVNFILNKNLQLLKYQLIPLLVDNRSNQFKTGIAQLPHENATLDIVKRGASCTRKENAQIQDCLSGHTGD